MHVPHTRILSFLYYYLITSTGGVRIGTPALTTRGFTETDFAAVAGLLHRGVLIALEVQKSANAKLVTEFVAALKGREVSVF